MGYRLKPGDLVKITRASVGIPLYTVGLILQTHKVENTAPFTEELIYHEVQLCIAQQRTVRRTSRDLELINASR